MLRTELIDLVVNLVIDPGLVVVYSVVLDRVPSKIGFEPIHYFNFFEMDYNTTLSSARNIADSIGLHRNLHGVICRHKWHFRVPTWFSCASKQSTSSEVDSDVAFRDLV